MLTSNNNVHSTSNSLVSLLARSLVNFNEIKTKQTQTYGLMTVDFDLLLKLAVTFTIVQ